MISIWSNAAKVPRSPVTLMHRVYRYVLPEVHTQLANWRSAAERITDEELRTQAIDSITHKQFHCEGGAVYAAAQLSMRHVLIPLIVAFQTISDYLDNLCDRSTSLDPTDFRRLHQAMLDAINPSAPLQDYYEFRTEKDDAGYLQKLVKTCQSCVSQLPGYENVQHRIEILVGLYCDLQVYKHIRKELREEELLAWWERNREAYPDLKWNEFAAATGSTLGVFFLFLAACDEQLTSEQSEKIFRAYFPHVCGLHILLDYLIDQEEDILGGDLNFCYYYGDIGLTVKRIEWIVERARADIATLPNNSFHRMIIEGLLALYLSDPKVKGQPEVRMVTRKLMRGSPMTRLFFWANSVWIRKKGG